MPVVKKQHFVPQFYLRNFVMKGSADKLYVFDKQSESTYVADIADVACRNYFYDIPDKFLRQTDEPQLIEQLGTELGRRLYRLLADRQFVERQFYGETVEAKFRTGYQSVLEALDSKTSLADTSRTDLATYIAIQFLRTPAQRKYLVSLFNESLISLGYKALASDQESAQDLEPLLHLLGMVLPSGVKKHAQALFGHIWIFGETDSDLPFFTSDNPVAHCYCKENGYEDLPSLNREGVEVIFPLSPKYILTMHERRYHSTRANLEGRLVHLERDHVKFYNSLLVTAGKRQIFSSDGNFDETNRRS